MSRLGDFFSDTFARAKSHEPGWIQRLPSMPGSPQALQDAFITNRWSHPYGSDASSMDVFAGGVGHPASSEQPWARAIGRTIGSIFLGKGLNTLTGTQYAGPAARGAANILSGQGDANGAPGLMGGGMGTLPANRPLIPPLATPDPFAEQGGQISPGLIAMLLASRQNGGDETQPSQAPYISAGGLA